jgi:hypothetical protein
MIRLTTVQTLLGGSRCRPVTKYKEKSIGVLGGELISNETTVTALLVVDYQYLSVPAFQVGVEHCLIIQPSDNNIKVKLRQRRVVQFMSMYSIHLCHIQITR